MTERRESEHDAVTQFVERILNAPDPHPYVGELDRVISTVTAAPDAALPLARRVSDPWCRSHALAAVARWIDDAKVEAVVGEAITAAMQCHDDYKRSAALAWSVACLVERGRFERAQGTLRHARAIAEGASPTASRAYSLLGLLQAAWPLGCDVRRSIVREMAELQRLDSYWRVSHSLVEAIRRVQMSDSDFAREIVAGMADERWQRKARAALGVNRL